MIPNASLDEQRTMQIIFSASTSLPLFSISVCEHEVHSGLLLKGISQRKSPSTEFY